MMNRKMYELLHHLLMPDQQDQAQELQDNQLHLLLLLEIQEEVVIQEQVESILTPKMLMTKVTQTTCELATVHVLR
jgi:hypothetical protein